MVLLVSIGVGFVFCLIAMKYKRKFQWPFGLLLGAMLSLLIFTLPVGASQSPIHDHT